MRVTDRLPPVRPPLGPEPTPRQVGLQEPNLGPSVPRPKPCPRSHVGRGWRSSVRPYVPSWGPQRRRTDGSLAPAWGLVPRSQEQVAELAPGGAAPAPPVSEAAGQRAGYFRPGARRTGPSPLGSTLDGEPGKTDLPTQAAAPAFLCPRAPADARPLRPVPVFPPVPEPTCPLPGSGVWGPLVHRRWVSLVENLEPQRREVTAGANGDPA